MPRRERMDKEDIILMNLGVITGDPEADVDQIVGEDEGLARENQLNERESSLDRRERRLAEREMRLAERERGGDAPATAVHSSAEFAELEEKLNRVESRLNGIRFAWGQTCQYDDYDFVYDHLVNTFGHLDEGAEEPEEDFHEEPTMNRERPSAWDMRGLSAWDTSETASEW